ncbi:MAG: hypothetical protein H7Z14_17415 [Anaerolineae bacterium]|nr:hypothetical protein [Phycisphaerae bacterium]
MSATRTAAKKHVDRRDDQPAASGQVFEPKPFKPHRKLFALLIVVNLVWIAALIVMYITTVRNAHPTSLQQRELEILQSDKLLEELTPATRPGASDLPSAPR